MFKYYKSLLNLFICIFLLTLLPLGLKGEISPEMQDIIEKVKADPTLSQQAQEILKEQNITRTPEEGVVTVNKETPSTKDISKIPSIIEQMFSEDASIEVQRNISQFGYNIFETPNKFSPVELTPVPPEYVIGPNDEIIISIWGKVQETFKVQVDRDGKIILPKIGAIYVWGLKFSELEPLIHKQLEQYYTNLQLSVTMGSLRSIKVFVLGEVKYPGSYTISALATSFYALFAAGGPTKLGSMRNIKVISGNSEKPIDLYDILLYGSKKSDYFLNSGDIIYVPSIGRIAGVAGSVKRPAIYELSGSETLNDLIQMAGDVTSIGYLKRIQIERIEAHKQKVVTELEFNKSSENFEIEDGDFILISPILPKRHNYVTIAGNVYRPGEYTIKPNFKIKDLIEEAEGIRPGTYMKRVEISRFKADKTQEIIPANLDLALQGDSSNNVLLSEWDAVKIYAETEVLPTRYVTISGAVKRPDRYSLTPNMTIEDLIFKAGGYLFNAEPKASEFCRVISGKTPQTANIDLNDSSSLNIKLQSSDWVFVRENIKWSELPYVILTGEVLHPGTYMISPNEKLVSIIKRAGGFIDKSFLDGAVFTRKDVRMQETKATQDFLTSTRKHLLQQTTMMQAANLTEAENKQGQELIKRYESTIDLISQIGIPGRIQIDLTSPKSQSFNISLKNGDSLHIPEIPSAVQIIGCVYNPSAIIYNEGKPVNWYIKEVGGLTPEGDKARMYVLQASGRINKGSNVKKGDIIIVPAKLSIRRPAGDAWKDIAQVLYQFGFSAMAVWSIYTTFKK
ncbi:MAG: SLBB domain-containing protein [bacterium]|nr:SLBB domain-containing protein [bacterium]